jgi:hypothetical protein
MPRLQSANNAQTTLNVNITNATTSFTVVNASLFPNAPFRITIDAEIMEVTAINKTTHTFTVIRAQEGTVAASHSTGATVENRWTAGTHAELADSASVIPNTQKGAANGVATLGSDGKVPATQLNVSSSADKITITDTGGYYTGTHVEAALQEVGQTLNLMRGDLVTSTNNILGG